MGLSNKLVRGDNFSWSGFAATMDLKISNF
jgi:hypothetical protein